MSSNSWNQKMANIRGWEEQAQKMKAGGMTSREIGKVLGKGKSTINDALKRLGKTEDVKGKSNKPRILLYDIETAPIIAQMWSMWQQGFGLNQIQSDWFIMSFAARFLGEDEVHYYDQSEAENMEDDSELLKKLWVLLDEADFAVGHNIKGFDTRKVNGRFLLNGLPKPSSYRQIDTLMIAKSQFGLTSNKLAYLSDKLCTDVKKSEHNEFPGHKLWSECLKGNKDAWKSMRDYNIADILSLEELYLILAEWDSKLPNFDVFDDEVSDNSDWMEDGFHYTNLGKYQRYRNVKTGQQRRGRVNLLSKAKRESLLANIV